MAHETLLDNTEKVKTSFGLNKLTYRKIKTYSSLKHINITDFINQLLEAQIEEYEKENFTPEFVTGINTQLITESN